MIHGLVIPSLSWLTVSLKKPRQTTVSALMVLNYPCISKVLSLSIINKFVAILQNTLIQTDKTCQNAVSSYGTPSFDIIPSVVKSCQTASTCSLFREPRGIIYCSTTFFCNAGVTSKAPSPHRPNPCASCRRPDT